MVSTSSEFFHIRCLDLELFGLGFERTDIPQWMSVVVTTEEKNHDRTHGPIDPRPLLASSAGEDHPKNTADELSNVHRIEEGAFVTGGVLYQS